MHTSPESPGTDAVPVPPPPPPQRPPSLDLALALVTLVVAGILFTTEIPVPAHDTEAGIKKIIETRDAVVAFVKDPPGTVIRAVPIPVINLLLVIPALIVWPMMAMTALLLCVATAVLQAFAAVAQAAVVIALWGPRLFSGALAVTAVGLVMGERWALAASTACSLAAAALAALALAAHRPPLAAWLAGYAVAVWALRLIPDTGRP